MQPLGQTAALPRISGGMLLRLHVMHQTLAAARHGQQFRIALLAPAPRNMQRLESLVEGDQMTIALRLPQSAVDVPKNRPNQASIQW